MPVAGDVEAAFQFRFDARGRAVVAYSPPEDVLVWGWFLASDEVAANGHELRVECDATVYLPLALAVKVGDRIELPGEGWFDVDRIVDYDRTLGGVRVSRT
ncbi:hypothetical protein GS836_24670 [Rhodococcus hoagii]|nr:hypothetical protein [Prescottella equi]